MSKFEFACTVLGAEPLGQVVASVPVEEHDTTSTQYGFRTHLGRDTLNIIRVGGPVFRISQSGQPEFPLETVVLKVKRPAESGSNCSRDSDSSRKWVM